MSESESPASAPPPGQEVVILKGLPGSGKSTWARAKVAESKGQYKRINKDDLREMVDGGQFSQANERFIVAARDALIRAALDAGKSVIVDDTNFDPEHEDRIRQIVGERAEVRVVFLDVDLGECIRRDAMRAKPVGKRVILEMYNQFLRGPSSARSSSMG